MMQTLTVKTARRTQLVDVTAQVQKAVAASEVTSGTCYLYVPHTTAAITINECTDRMWRARSHATTAPQRHHTSLFCTAESPTVSLGS